MDVPVQVEPSFGRRISPVGKGEDGRGIVEAEAYGETAEVGLLVSEDCQLPIDEQTGSGHRLSVGHG
ncbi:hypothetical protein DY245_22300 [Streptomyces inhibens]|uniref:Uncharacterized protein n=1 Tax=Streptomyces inhibens TaxID=2293571 RepID=A0A371Q0E3_STRIH|nr:hypothetical protein [Streptomyces inhibens]REK88242.1 hypothetical protein DY245_22300 [Streptomyces inhibens]